MEPPAKRSRLGPAPFDDKDDVDADELDVRPEELNARRDPDYQLGRSRAFAALKLKSAFERIFEKYERDFTGVADEIDLKTCEIVVDNGHLRSLKIDKNCGLQHEDDGSSESVSLDEEERILQGASTADHRLSRLVLTTLPPLTSQSRPSNFSVQWPGPLPLMAGPSMLPTAMYPPHIHFGSFPMPYGALDPLDNCTESRWRMPDLPRPVYGGRFNLAGVGSVSRAVSKMPRIAGLEDNGDDEDDILLGISTATPGHRKSDGTPIAKKRLPLRLLPVPHSRSNDELPVINPQKTPKDSSSRMKNKSAKNSSTEAERPKGMAEELDGNSLRKTAKKSQLPSRKQPPVSSSLQSRRDRMITPRTSDSESTEKETSRACASTRTPETPVQEKGQFDVYIDLSVPAEKSATKPLNQRLRVEIAAKTVADLVSFRAVTPDTTPEVKLSQPLDPEQDQGSGEPRADRNGVAAPNCGPPSPERVTEFFLRNNIDPAYSFSDEDEPTLPRSRSKHHKPGSTVKRSPPVPHCDLNGMAADIETPAHEAKVTDSSTNGLGNANSQDNSSTPLLVPGVESANEMAPGVSSAGENLERGSEVATAPSENADETTTVSQQKAPGEPVSVSQDSGNDETSQSAAKQKLKRKRRRASESSKSPNPKPMVNEVPILVEITLEATAEPELNIVGRLRSSQKQRASRPSEVENGHMAPAKAIAETDRASESLREDSTTIQQVSNAVAETEIPDSDALADSSPADLITDLVDLGPMIICEDDRAVQQDQEPIAEVEIPDSDTLTPSSPMVQQQVAKEQIPELAPSTNTSSPCQAAGPALHTALSPKTKEKAEQRENLPATPMKQTLPRHRPSSNRDLTPSSRRGILSLLSDDEDELSLGPEDFTPSGSRRKHSPAGSVRLSFPVLGLSSSVRKKNWSLKKGLLSSHSKRIPLRTTLARFAAAGGGGTPLVPSFRGRGDEGDGGSSPSRVGSELIQTPGGSMRRCGEGDFRCDRDFCFVCL
ncbi:hypothetical protein B0H63DRAFT_460725 [Podospora didyma]|uniref:Myb-like DNA-binding domain protein n=1 Tax=Podospora didyma TaxID=330526 RepID=A0AAE0U8E1_9PEZI|nr:hypothetical protein B0H63DRAFT_460725 [Podospora didyma]